MMGKGKGREDGEGIITNNEVRTKKKESPYFQHSPNKEQSDQPAANH